MVFNPVYFESKIVKQINRIYAKDSPKNVLLENLFQKPVLVLLQKKLHDAKYDLKFDPYEYSYGVAKLKEIDSFLCGRYFNDLVKNILGIKKYKVKYEIRRFEPGNFTLLNDHKQEKPGVDFIINLSRTDEFHGGYIKYLTQDSELIQVNPIANSLTFVERKKGVMNYTKYVSHKQKEPIIMVVGTIQK